MAPFTPEEEEELKRRQLVDLRRKQGYQKQESRRNLNNLVATGIVIMIVSIGLAFAGFSDEDLTLGRGVALCIIFFIGLGIASLGYKAGKEVEKGY